MASVRAIADTLASGKKKVDHKTIGKYIDALRKAFAFYRIRFARLGTKNMD